MNDWIELNLPYYVYNNSPSIPLPDLSVKENELFGKDPLVIDSDHDLHYRSEGLSLLNKIQDELTTNESKKSETSLSILEKYIESSFDERIQKINKEYANKIIAYRRRSSLIDQWWDKQPEIIQWRKDCDELRTKKAEITKLLSFTGAGS